MLTRAYGRFGAVCFLAVVGLVVGTASDASAGWGHRQRCYTCPPACPPQVIYSNHCRYCGPTVQTSLVVCHPCTGCQIPVTVCVPACCAAEVPATFCRKTLFGSGLTRFSWCCGYDVTVRFQKCGDLTVRY